MRLRILFCFTLVFFIFQRSGAQTDNSIGNWNVFVLKGKIAEHYFYNTEFSFRKYPHKPIYDYSEYKLVFGRTLTKYWSVDLGTGLYTLSLTGDFLHSSPSRKENRIWIDFLFKYSWYRIYFDQRVRIEQRFHMLSGAPNRFRYKPLVTIPVNHFNITSRTFYLMTSIESYFGTGEHTLEATMFFLGGGYRFGNRLTVNAGNMNNYDLRKTSDRTKNYLYLTFIYDLGKKGKTFRESPNTILSGN